MRWFCLLLLLLLVIGCKRGANTQSVPEAVEAGSGAFSQLGPVGLRIESVRLGKVRIRGMMGQDGESKEDVFVVHTRFKLLGAGPVKGFAVSLAIGILASLFTAVFFTRLVFDLIYMGPRRVETVSI